MKACDCTGGQCNKCCHEEYNAEERSFMCYWADPMPELPPSPPLSVPTAAPTVSPTEAPTAVPTTAPSFAPTAAPSVTDGEFFDDPHVKTLSGASFFMHGVGVFDYASIPGMMRTQVFMCPEAACTKDRLEAGQCLTYVQAVAITLKNGHRIMLQGSTLRVDGVDRTYEANITLGTQTMIKATGKVAATATLPRVNHAALADCHLPTPGRDGATTWLSESKKKKPTVTPLANASKVAASCRHDEVCNCKIFARCSGRHPGSTSPEPSAQYPRHTPDHYCSIYGLCGKDLPEHLVDRKRTADECTTCGLQNNCCNKGGTWEGKCPAHHSWEEGNAACMGLGDTQAAAVGGWQDCTTVEWTVATPEMSLEIGVIGPFEEGFLNEQIGDRTFNVAVSGVKNAHAGQSAGSFNPPQPRPGGPTVRRASACSPSTPSALRVCSPRDHQRRQQRVFQARL